MKPMKCIIFFMLVAFPALALAEFYRYVDEQGNVHYTDDLASVPSDQLPKINQYEEAESQPATKKQPEAEEGKIETSKSSSSKTEEEGDLRTNLRKREGELEAEYEALTEERGQLEKASQEALTPEARRELAEKIDAFNERMQDYRTRRQAFSEEVEAYNASLKKEAPSPKAEEE